MTKYCDSIYARASHWQRVKRSLSRSWLCSGSPGHMAQAPPLPLTGRKRECPSRGGFTRERTSLQPPFRTHLVHVILTVRRQALLVLSKEAPEVFEEVKSTTKLPATKSTTNYCCLIFICPPVYAIWNVLMYSTCPVDCGAKKQNKQKKTTATKTTAILNMDECPLQFGREKCEFILKRGATPQRFGEEINSLWIIKCLFLKILWRWRNAHTRKKKKEKKACGLVRWNAK